MRWNINYMILSYELNPQAGVPAGGYGIKNRLKKSGEMAEWSIASASKADGPKGLGGSNPPLSGFMTGVFNEIF